MTFTSFLFIGCFVAVAAVYYVIPRRWQWVWLLAASLAYYAYFDVRAVGFLLISILSTYVMARLIARAKAKGGSGKPWLIAILVINLGLLAVMKYSGMFTDWALIVPVGISFYTFKVVSYAVDVFRGKYEPEKNPGKYALYVSFFPQIVSGPIQRADSFLPQLAGGKRFDYEKVKKGFVLFFWGLLKKIVLADRLGILVDEVFNNVGSHDCFAFIVAVLLFTLQIYYDFSGYSDMAVGCGLMLGFDTEKNFDRPYFSRSIGEFWRRWHISLSSWFRDYLYIPLGGNRVGKWRWAFNILVVFLVSGLWHGAGYTFLIWGGLHGVYQIIGKWTKDFREKIWQKIGLAASPVRGGLARIVNFLLVAFAWLFFRANSLLDAARMGHSVLTWSRGSVTLFRLGLEENEFIVLGIGAALVWLVEFLQGRFDVYEKLQKQILPVRWLVYLVLIFGCILFGLYGNLSAASFIYFQF